MGGTAAPVPPEAFVMMWRKSLRGGWGADEPGRRTMRLQSGQVVSSTTQPPSTSVPIAFALNRKSEISTATAAKGNAAYAPWARRTGRSERKIAAEFPCPLSVLRHSL